MNQKQLAWIKVAGLQILWPGGEGRGRGGVCVALEVVVIAPPPLASPPLQNNDG